MTITAASIETQRPTTQGEPTEPHRSATVKHELVRINVRSRTRARLVPSRASFDPRLETLAHTSWAKHNIVLPQAYALPGPVDFAPSRYLLAPSGGGATGKGLRDQVLRRDPNRQVTTRRMRHP